VITVHVVHNGELVEVSVPRVPAIGDLLSLITDPTATSEMVRVTEVAMVNGRADAYCRVEPEYPGPTEAARQLRAALN